MLDSYIFRRRWTQLLCFTSSVVGSLDLRISGISLPVFVSSSKFLFLASLLFATFWCFLHIVKRARTDVEHSHRVQVKQCTLLPPESHRGGIRSFWNCWTLRRPGASLKCDASDVNSWSLSSECQVLLSHRDSTQACRNFRIATTLRSTVISFWKILQGILVAAWPTREALQAKMGLAEGQKISPVFFHDKS